MDAIKKIDVGTLKKRSLYLECLAEISAKLAGSIDSNKVLSWIVHRLRVVSEADRCYIFENHKDPSGALLTSQKFEDCAKGIEPQINNPDCKDFPWAGGGMDRWADILSAQGIICGAVADFPECEQAILAPQGIIRIMALPLMVFGQWYGFIGFDGCTEELEWNDKEVSLLQSAANTICVAIERYRSEKALRESETRYKELFNSLQEGVALVDEKETIVECNPSFARILDETNENNVIGKSLFDYLKPEQQDIIRTQTEARKKNIISSYRINVRSAKGYDKILKVTSYPRFNTDNKYTGAFGTTVDITDRVLAEKSLQESRAQFKAFQSAITDVIYRYDPMGESYDFISPSFKKQTGYTLDEIKTKPKEFTRSITHPDDRERVFKEVDDFIRSHRSNRPIITEYRVIRKDGKIIWMRDIKTIEFTPDGKLFRINGIVSDITEIKNTQLALQEAQSALELRIQERTKQLALVNEELLAEREALNQKNAALKEILNQIEEEKRQIALQIQSNIDSIVMPIIEQLKSKADIRNKHLLPVLRDNLADIASPFLSILESRSNMLSPREIEICNLIRNGLTTKQIANTLNRSEQTISKQRNKIRQKLHITNKKVNLAAYLKTIR